MTLTDDFNRHFFYLRLSITELCNFRCVYCLPNGNTCSTRNFLTLDEIRRVLTAFAELGIEKVRITGGEPTLRNDLPEIINLAVSIPGIKKVALSTNGYRLKKLAKPLYDAGLNAITISVDSLVSETFHQITQHDWLSKILQNIEQVCKLGFSTIKVNAALLKSVNDNELTVFLDWIRSQPICVRFVELMRTQDNQKYFARHHLSSEVIRQQLIAGGWQEKIREKDAGPALEFSHPDYLGTFGLIAPYSKDFCTHCNRLRVSSVGNLHLCLFGDGHYSLRSLLQSDNQKERLKQVIQERLHFKKAAHSLHEGKFGTTVHLASIGG